MHSIYFLIGLTGMSVCLWTLGDIFRVIVLDCMYCKCKMQQKVLASHWAESHTKMVLKMCSVDVTVEEFQEVFIETVEPFLE